MRQKHTFPPEFDSDSRILILGSFPSVKSREQNFYYGHPQNRFWPLLAKIFEEKLPESIEEKKQLLHRNHIALWDVIQSCEITGSSDSSIRDVTVNDLSIILTSARIEKIFVNGGTADRLYRKSLSKETNRMAEKLPSSSPANAAWNMDRLYEEWKKIRIEEDGEHHGF